MEFVNGSKVFNTVDANTFAFYAELNDVIQKEPIDFLDPELRGQAASIGIVKGKPFAPDERMKKILTEAVAVGNATARAISLPQSRPPRLPLQEQPVEDAASSAAITAGSTATAWPAATSTPARCSSTSPP